MLSATFVLSTLETSAFSEKIAYATDVTEINAIINIPIIIFFSFSHLLLINLHKYDLIYLNHYLRK